MFFFIRCFWFVLLCFVKVNKGDDQTFGAQYELADLPSEINFSRQLRNFLPGSPVLTTCINFCFRLTQI